MTSLTDILDVCELDRQISDKMVKRVVSPDGRHVLYNYTDAATYSRTWTNETRKCRGLIARADTGEIVCRPFDKFFNYGESGAPELPSDFGDIDATNKLDGSMVAVWWDDKYGWSCTTRGSFTSDQASAAQAWLDGHIDPTELVRGHTYICEWTAPDNRVVLKYDKPELSLLAVRDNATGDEIDFDSDYATACGFGYAMPWRFADLASLVAARSEMRDVEGWVLRWRNGTDVERVKVKTDEYLRLHKIISGFSPERVREMMLSGEFGAREYIAQLPDEIQDEANEIYHEIARRVGLKVDEMLYEHAKRAHILDDGRKQYAIAVCADFAGDDRAYLFALADGRDIRSDVLKRVNISDIQTSVKL